ncbi:uncharacterized protein [Euwallacea fornicatus]|uniref:uncharacterized protein n=1 Tax=Euwallacea fornicatus TaxID=995702 RepID=UPI00338DB5D3
MEPRRYVHMGPKPAEEVSCIWRAAHVVVFVLLIGSSSVAAVCVYNILDMYKFNCIIYAKMSFEKRYEDRFKDESNSSEAVFSSAVRNSIGGRPEGVAYAWADIARAANDERRLPYVKEGSNNTGFLNMRKTVFATSYICNLMFFAPLASVIMCIFLVALTGMGGKGGTGNPGNVLPNPWICVYPFLGLCAFMMVLSFIASNLFHKGLGSFCLRYFELTKTKSCSKLMDGFNVQFSPGRKGPPKPFYKNYRVGGYALHVTSALWVLQSLVYIFRISCLADFTLYLTSIKMKNDDVTDPNMAGVVSKQLDSKNKKV